MAAAGYDKHVEGECSLGKKMRGLMDEEYEQTSGDQTEILHNKVDPRTSPSLPPGKPYRTRPRQTSELAISI
jgi:hypothetical protein